MLRTLCLLTSVFLTTGSLQATTTLNFEGFSDSTNLTTQYAGTTFSNAIILSAGVSLNEFEFPPHSGVNVVSDNGGPIDIAFSTPVSSVSGFFTYAHALNISGFDATNNLVGTAVSHFSNNEALSGDLGSSPNEVLQILSNARISKIEIAGDSAGGSFVLDDFSFSPTVVPEIDPNSGAAALALLAGVLLIVRDQRNRAA